MKRALALLLLAACGRPPEPSAERSCKPEAPVAVAVRLVGEPRAGSTVGLVVTATALADGDVDLRVGLPEGLSLARGSTSVTSRLRRGESRELRLDLAVPDAARREVVASASITVGGARMVSVASVVLNDAPIPRRGTLKTNSRGEAILEHRAE